MSRATGRDRRTLVALVRLAAFALVLMTLGAVATPAFAQTEGTNENEHAVMTATCTSLKITYRNFPNLPNNVVKQTITIHGAKWSSSTITFNGSETTVEMPIVVPPGEGNVDDHASWNTNGVKGQFDLAVPLECPPAPAFSIVKRQKIAGEESFTTAPLVAKVGQKVDYEIIVTNTGNVPLKLKNFIDGNCSSITGGPGTESIKKGGTTTYKCSHTLTQEGKYTNAATVTGEAAAPFSAPPVTHTSNTVEVVAQAAPKPAFAIKKLQEIAGSNAGFTPNPLLAETGQTVDYEIVVTNTGNTPLTFGNFVDEQCEGVTGGFEGEILPGESTTYFCSHLLTEEPPYQNTSATVTGTPPPADGGPITHTSNPVEVIASPGEGGEEENEKAKVIATCSYISVTYQNFPNLPGNTVTQTITIHGVKVSTIKFTFDGPTGTSVVPIVVPPGTGVADAHAIWSTNGVKGTFDVAVSLECPPRPKLDVTKLQEIEGSNTGFTEAPLSGEVGQRVNYEIIVHNAGNTTLKIKLLDEGCEAVTGGPAGNLAIRKSTTYFCSHVLTEAGTYENTAAISAVKSRGPAEPFTTFSNTVSVNVP